MLHHSLRWFYATNVTINETVVTGTNRINSSDVTNMLKGSTTINNQINSLIDNAASDSFSWRDVLTLNDTTDMFLSFNNATVSLSTVVNLRA